MKQHLGAGFVILALAAALTGCAGGSGTNTPAASTPAASAAAPTTSSAAPKATSSASGSTSTAAAAGVDLKTTSSSAGDIVVDAKGMAVYFYTKDVKDSGTSTCTGGCLTAWPPVLTTSAEPKVEGVTGTVGTIATPEGAKQVTLNGLPLYYFAKDTKAGDILGQGVNDVWYLSDPAGEMIKTAAK
jgi:predicted lipoprotein with Yx(FWY)xxD motif